MHRWSHVLDELVRDRGPGLLRYGYLLTGSADDAQDLVQEAIVRVLTRKPRLRAAATLESYVRRTMLTILIDDSRRTRRWREVQHLVAAPAVAPDAYTGADDRDALDAALATLSPRQRVCVVLRYLEGLSGAEIAATLGISEGAVRRYLSDALDRLGTALGPLAAPPPAPDTEVELAVERSHR
ncbi:RNA polymerase sigma factor [Cellulomonas sp. URHB0016]